MTQIRSDAKLSNTDEKGLNNINHKQHNIVYKFMWTIGGILMNMINYMI